MGRQLVSITPAGHPAFQVLFNPTNYGITKANQIAEAAIPGLNAPILQYVHGNTRTLDMEFFSDTYEKGIAVTTATNNIYNLLLIDPATHAPPICEIAWGTFIFQGVLDHVN